MSGPNQFLLYTAANGAVKVEVFFKDETVWLTQKALADLFGVKVPAINKHLKNIFESGELTREATVSKMEIAEASTNSRDAKMFFRCLLMAGTLTPNSSARAFCVSQTVSSLKNTSTFTAPSGAV